MTVVGIGIPDLCELYGTWKSGISGCNPDTKGHCGNEAGNIMRYGKYVVKSKKYLLLY